METTPWHSLTIDEALKRLSSHASGLTAAEAAERLTRFGRNEIPRRKPLSPLRLLLRQFANFFVWVLLFAAALAYTVSFLPGEEGRRLTAFFILGIVALSVALSFFEEYRAQKEMAALDRLLTFKATVLRDNTPHQIDAAEVVPGDILVLTHGQKVPADARLIEARSLRADESALTGESLGVDKSIEPAREEAPLAERASMVFGATYLTRGSGSAVAVRTGLTTEVGRIAATLEEMAERPTPFQVEVQRMAGQMTALVGTLALFVALILLFALHESWIDVALNTLSLAVATIPESLPVVLAFALALGAHRMVLCKAIVRRLSVVESLGSVDTVCTDKTGTLTQNLMTVQHLFADDQVLPLPPDRPIEAGSAFEVLRAGLLCNEASVEEAPPLRIIGDPVDAALLRAAQSAGLDVAIERSAAPKVNEIPFSSERKRMTSIHQHGEQFTAYTKGAPEAVLARCGSVLERGQIMPLTDARRRKIDQVLREWEEEAWYLLALAQKELPSAELTKEAEEGMTFLGLQALIDPPRSSAAEAIARAKGAGIRVIMITGDNALTARAVGSRLGIGGRFVEAGELDLLDRDALRARMKEVDIVARATPQTKRQVLQALQDDGHFVAMTGDGVNDATALKQADVGVAMGLRGTDIAKESADMILLDDHFATLVDAIKEGRRIFDNIRKFTNYLLSTSLGEVVVVLALSASGYFPLSAKMLLWVNVVTDLIPAGALAADPAVPHIMQRRPRRHDEPILNKALYATIAGSVFRTLIAYGLIFWIGLRLGDITYARTMLFTSIVLHAFTRVLVVRQLDHLSFWSNRALLWSYGAAVVLQLLALYTPLRHLFGIIPLDGRAWGVMLPVVALSSLAGVYMTRWILRRVPMW
ncbi:MAG: cation-transporting P-type ATPase [Candidatus Manganitrophaceae bacterium]